MAKSWSKLNVTRFTARKYDPSQTISDEDLNKLKTTYDKAQRNLLRWTITNFGEAFHMWVHLKCIQVFVESVLRYGLPANFQAMLVIVRAFCLGITYIDSQEKITSKNSKNCCAPTTLTSEETSGKILMRNSVAKSSSLTFSLRHISNKPRLINVPGELQCIIFSAKPLLRSWCSVHHD